MSGKEIDIEGLETLNVIEKANKFNKWMYETIKPYSKGRILEIGCGIGNISEFFINDNFDIVLSDLRDNYIEIVKNRGNVKTIITEDGDHNIIYNEKYLKIPDSPSVRLDENGPQIIINGKNVDSKSFLDMDHSKIYFLEVTEKETNENNIVVVKKIEVKTK